MRKDSSMTDKQHALLSASSSHRWLTVPPIARLEEFFENPTSLAAQEGTLAHALAEHKLRLALGEDSQLPEGDIDLDMDMHTDDYVAYISDEMTQAKQVTPDPIFIIEQRVDFSRYVPEGFGTADAIIVADNSLHVIDFKYGKGVLVDSENNSQMRLYALGALELFDALYDIAEIKMTIFQPRKGNVSTSIMTRQDLLKWAEEVVKPQAELAFKGEGEITYGPWCQFSPCNAVLRARHDWHQNLHQYQLASPYLLTDAEIEAILPHVDNLAKWATEVKDYATKVAMASGKSWSGFKLVQGRSNRKFSDDKEVIAVAEKEGVTDIYTQSLVSLTELEKRLGKKEFNRVFGHLVTKPKGKVSLVPDTDKRQALSSATEDFGGN
ncbi:TPA: DUF2800 domain-containing protein [Streptococcus suis]|nr:DUF2800 domain-containing protein [Streptococcus suis]